MTTLFEEIEDQEDLRKLDAREKEPIMLALVFAIRLAGIAALLAGVNQAVQFCQTMGWMK